MPDVVVADIGGTHARFVRHEVASGHARARHTLASSGYLTLEAAIDAFLAASEGPIAALVLAIAGPVRDGRAVVTNLPWVIDEHALTGRYGAPATLLNDFEAVARGMAHVSDAELSSIHPGPRADGELVAVLGAGTGLGQALVVPVGDRVRIVASEGGHSDFGPWDARSDRILVRLRERYGGHVSVERVASGLGLADLYEIVTSEGWAAPMGETHAAIAAGNDVGRVLGAAPEDPAAQRTLEIFARALGAEAGNLALKCLPRGGVRIAGGILPKLLASGHAARVREALVAGYLDKGRMRAVLAPIPVDVVIAEDVGLRGAIAVARSLV